MACTHLGLGGAGQAHAAGELALQVAQVGGHAEDVHHLLVVAERDGRLGERGDVALRVPRPQRQGGAFHAADRHLNARRVAQLGAHQQRGVRIALHQRVPVHEEAGVQRVRLPRQLHALQRAHGPRPGVVRLGDCDEGGLGRGGAGRRGRHHDDAAGVGPVLHAAQRERASGGREGRHGLVQHHEGGPLHHVALHQVDLALADHAARRLAVADQLHHEDAAAGVQLRERKAVDRAVQRVLRPGEGCERGCPTREGTAAARTDLHAAVRWCEGTRPSRFMLVRMAVPVCARAVQGHHHRDGAAAGGTRLAVEGGGVDLEDLDEQLVDVLDAHGQLHAVLRRPQRRGLGRERDLHRVLHMLRLPPLRRRRAGEQRVQLLAGLHLVQGRAEVDLLHHALLQVGGHARPHGARRRALHTAPRAGGAGSVPRARHLSGEALHDLHAQLGVGGRRHRRKRELRGGEAAQGGKVVPVASARVGGAPEGAVLAGNGEVAEEEVGVEAARPHGGRQAVVEGEEGEVGELGAQRPGEVVHARQVRLVRPLVLPQVHVLGGQHAAQPLPHIRVALPQRRQPVAHLHQLLLGQLVAQVDLAQPPPPLAPRVLLLQQQQHRVHHHWRVRAVGRGQRRAARPCSGRGRTHQLRFWMRPRTRCMSRSDSERDSSLSRARTHPSSFSSLTLPAGTAQRGSMRRGAVRARHAAAHFLLSTASTSGKADDKAEGAVEWPAAPPRSELAPATASRGGAGMVTSILLRSSSSSALNAASSGPIASVSSCLVDAGQRRTSRVGGGEEAVGELEPVQLPPLGAAEDLLGLLQRGTQFFDAQWPLVHKVPQQ